MMLEHASFAMRASVPMAKECCACLHFPVREVWEGNVLLLSRINYGVICEFQELGGAFVVVFVGLLAVTTFWIIATEQGTEFQCLILLNCFFFLLLGV